MALKHVEYKGELLTIEQLHNISGLSKEVIRSRLRKGYSPEEAIADSVVKKSIKTFGI